MEQWTTVDLFFPLQQEKNYKAGNALSQHQETKFPTCFSDKPKIVLILKGKEVSMQSDIFYLYKCYIPMDLDTGSA